MPIRLESKMPEPEAAQPVKNRRPMIFLGVGVINTLLDFAFYTLLTHTVFKDSIGVAGIVSGTISLFIAFLTHSFITWRGTEVSHRTLLRFFVVTGFGMWVIRPILLSLFIKLTPLYEWAHSLSSSLHLPFSYDFVAKTGAFGFMVILVLLYNYFTYDRFVFKKYEEKS